MIAIAGNIVNSEFINNIYKQNSIEKKITEIMMKSRNIYGYDSEKQLDFELKLRKSIIEAAKDLNKSKFAFKIFRKSTCNTDYWHRTLEGGFRLKEGVKPSDAIRDIYSNSSKYGTECSTAMVIIYYKALLDVLPEEVFNKLYSHIYLMNWQHLDRDLEIINQTKVPDYLPGDCRYIKNPSVDPLHPEWQGENVIDLGNGMFYGHGIGIATVERIIEELNKKRIKGSTISAFLMGYAKRQNYKRLSDRV